MSWRGTEKSVKFISFLIAVSAIGSASAQRGSAPAAPKSTAWFGTPLPPPVSDPRKPVMKYDDAFAPLPAAFALTMLLTTPRGDAYTAKELEAMARQAGFRSVAATPLSPSPQTLLELLC